MKSFDSWFFDEIEIEFGIERNDENIILKSWLESQKEIEVFEKRQLDIYKHILKNNVNAWNEDELKMQFIAPLLALINFNTPKFKPFTQRSLTLSNEKYQISGIVDFMIATGKTRPKEPYFFLHEYKQQHPSKKNDPLGQLLIAMIVAQIKNDDTNPVYGVLVEGRAWYFIVLHEKEYAVSSIYDACVDDIYQIYSILCKVKNYIEIFLAN